MRVDPSGTPTSVPQTTSGVPSRAVARTSESASPAPEAASFEPTSELAKLLTLVSQAPEVRSDVVKDVATRFAAGELNTPDAATDTARAFLGDNG